MKKGTWSGLSWGVVLFAITIGTAQFLNNHQVIELFALVMVLIGSVYIGFALREDRYKYRVIEIAVSALFILSGITGLWISPWIIVIGLFLHGFWDIYHHNENQMTQIPEWYIPLCVIYDWAAAAYLAYFIYSI